MKLLLVRDLSLTQGYLVRSKLFLSSKEMNPKIKTLDIKENLLYLADEGKYILRYEHSPKFKKRLWEFYGTGLRKEIKFHFGTKAEHSRGCPLMGNSALRVLHNSLDSTKDYQIQIINI